MLNSKLNEKTVTWVLLGIIILLSVCLRFYDLGGESYWFDEVIMLDVAKQDLWTILQGSRPQIYVILAHFWLEVFGTSEVATRSLSALAGVISIPLMYAVGKQIFDNKVGLISAFLMAVSQFQIYYSQDFRYYSFFVLITLSSFLLFIQFLKTRKISYLVCYMIASILLIYTHTFGIFILVAQNLYFLIKWKSYRDLKFNWGLCQIFIVLAVIPRILPYLDMVIEGKAGPLKWLPEPSLSTPLISLQYYIGAGLDYPSWITISLATAFLVIGTFLFAVFTGIERWMASVRGLASSIKKITRVGSQLLLVITWLIVPIILPYILSEIFIPMYHHRYVIGASPAFYLLLAFIISKIGKVVPEFITLGMIVIVITPGLYEFYVTPVREQWREAAAYVEQNSQENDVIVISEIGRDNNLKNFNWYFRGNLSECSIGVRLKRGDEIKEALERCISGHNRFWLVVREEPIDIQDFKKFFLDSDYGLQLITKHEFTKVTVFLFGIKGGVLNTN